MQFFSLFFSVKHIQTLFSLHFFAQLIHSPKDKTQVMMLEKKFFTKLRMSNTWLSLLRNSVKQKGKCKYGGPKH